MTIYNIFLWNSEFEQRIVRKFLIDCFNCYTQQLVYLMKNNQYVVGERLKN